MPDIEKSSFESDSFELADFGDLTVSNGKSVSDVALHRAQQHLASEFSKHRDRLWQAVHVRLDPRLCGRIDPDDVLQEAYMDAVNRIQYFVDQDSYSPFVWLRLTVGQTLINVHRRHFGAQKRDASREVSAARSGYQYSATTASMVHQFCSGITSPSQMAIKRESLAELEQALDNMKPIDREILTLRHFEDLSNKEAAELLGIAPKAASIRYIRAIERLKKFMDDSRR